ncbi:MULTISPECIES: UDP-2,4-diacetamido-2,4,6-trideoxy-beta-L-altropyranose hydrolase [unclassified Guyparkeria]|uniref:UDP-2,4-diacetamido-2,4, 6-trideoxy-beta-L-altropyranose hydrolase n=1 Tax=unclassified Guyparkeria TaxID=2626246 RepID=UPI00073386D7|nr:MULTISPECIES: UDP-2,4-diacetamido-2,4,6-trideoxy-beta-L-altropyranose hydrolase [unclassified Guyparkeria]KTG16106.1 UDP-2,4-diacetamido-2,4,6-trideoxy-beta-L-altropyranose hydrolase [Guyparkeria sp. XI15]OAE84957.1 UDP-2,4-diacetamido-2,4,6-trideoxy-beta-L-altropyranose hydrolase [Guyparkeria sp. WRN-7]
MTDGETIVFRTDASLQIGTGHVMRCLTLADALRGQGRECHFICREHPGHLVDAIRERGFPVHVLPVSEEQGGQSAAGPAHAPWLGASWETDARQTAEVLQGLHPSWVVVDHYALDARWEATVRPQGTGLMVLDDLADRSHQADVLLDQNLGRQAGDYGGLVPEDCRLLIGPRHALLRPEFAQLREDSLRRRRRSPRLKRLLVSMGGMDKDNVTGKVLDALRAAPLPSDLQIDVVMGGNAPWLRQVQDQAAAMPRPTRVMVDIPDMAQRMAEADFAIGAAGSTSWERCCLGLPAVMVVLAENQRGIAAALAVADACICLDDADGLAELPERWNEWTRPGTLRAMSRASASITDGQGAARVCQQLNQEA